MALINCPECGKEISDKSKVCIYCGYPLEENLTTLCNINGVQYNIDFIMDKSVKSPFRAKQLHLITKCDILECIKFVNKVDETNEIPKFVYLKPQETKKQITQNTPHCPTCSSTNIRKISGISKAGSIAMWGIFSRKVHKQWHCNNCSSEW